MVKRAKAFDRNDCNVAFGVLLDKPAANKNDLVTSIQAALSGADRTFSRAKVTRFMDTIGCTYKVNIVRAHVPAELRVAHAKPRARRGGGKGCVEFRIADNFAQLMNAAGDFLSPP